MTERPSMPSVARIATYWMAATETASVLPNLKAHLIGWGEPFCFACGWLAPIPDGDDAWAHPHIGGWLERAHLVDHWLGGEASPANIVPLCHFCHFDMTDAYEWREDALAWVSAKTSTVPWPTIWQAYTTTHLWGWTPSRSTMLRAKADYLELMLKVQLQVA